ncbi:hypothetical protein TNCV_1818481 [Trichonephila clavipes]|nr:hypothetical protein TNCV_1818471 [Trichonephila clavipes]GFU84516.1 hypothetical protein TNCV_1818481 [Trichonephila clavipes]
MLSNLLSSTIRVPAPCQYALKPAFQYYQSSCSLPVCSQACFHSRPITSSTAQRRIVRNSVPLVNWSTIPQIRMPNPHNTVLSTIPQIRMPNPHNTVLSTIPHIRMPNPHNTVLSTIPQIRMPNPHNTVLSTIPQIRMPNLHNTIPSTIPQLKMKCPHCEQTN